MNANGVVSLLFQGACARQCVQPADCTAPDASCDARGRCVSQGGGGTGAGKNDIDVEPGVTITAGPARAQQAAESRLSQRHLRPCGGDIFSAGAGLQLLKLELSNLYELLGRRAKAERLWYHLAARGADPAAVARLLAEPLSAPLAGRLAALPGAKGATA